MAGSGWRNVSITEEMAARVKEFIATNSWGYKSRGEVVTAALRQFLEGEALTRAELRRALRAVAATEPQTVEELLSALQAELDMEVRHGAQAKTPKSSSESTKRR